VNTTPQEILFIAHGHIAPSVSLHTASFHRPCAKLPRRAAEFAEGSTTRASRGTLCSSALPTELPLFELSSPCQMSSSSDEHCLVLVPLRRLLHGMCSSFLFSSCCIPEKLHARRLANELLSCQNICMSPCPWFPVMRGLCNVHEVVPPHSGASSTASYGNTKALQFKRSHIRHTLSSSLRGDTTAPFFLDVSSWTPALMF
jgi:hypothetical protein